MEQLEKIIFNYFSQDNNFYDKDFFEIKPAKIRDRYILIKGYLKKNYKIGDKIAIYLIKDYQYVILMLVCLELGLTFVPLNKKHPKNRAISIINIVKPDLIIVDEHENFGFKQVLLSNIFKTNIRGKNTLSSISKDNIAYIIFTSGSTGEPKGVMIKRESYANFVQWVNQYFITINDNDRLLNTADFTFDLSLIDIALLLSKNIHFFISKFDANIFELMSEIEKEKITTMATVPNNFQMLLSRGVYGRGDIHSLKHLLIGGARFSYGLYNKLKESLQTINIYNLYGPTEATVYCCVKKIEFNDDDCRQENISVGKAILNTDIRIVDKDRNEQDMNQVGSLLVGGIQVMDKYINSEEKNKEIFIVIDKNIYYDTGDLSFIDSNGNIFIVGRSDDSLKVSGYRVNLSDIDSYIQKLSYIDECATIALEDDVKENVLVSFVKLCKKIGKEKVFTDLKDTIAQYQIPRDLVFLDDFPLNSSGKICKKTLKKNYQTYNDDIYK
jgi:D-alanine--poly(phosphoribitol) ligase subunit 1